MAVLGGENWREELKIEGLFKKSPVALFSELQVLEDAMSYLKQHGYIVYEFDCHELSTLEALCYDILYKLGNIESDFPHRHMSATQFWDLLSADVPSESGMVLAFKYFDAFHREHPERAQHMMETLAGHHLSKMRRGLRFATLAHCEHAIKLEPLMIIEARWNEQKWEAASIEQFERGLRSQKAMEAAREQLTERHPDLSRYTFNKALEEVTGVHPIQLGSSRDLSTEDILRLLQDYDFGS